jgi:8-hydroxy-5-deazaflavin:NADPH oxidoreductase
MRIGVLGTGTVGRTLASKLAELGHEVTMGSRDAANEAAGEWAAAAGGAASHGTFADAAAAAELVVNATAGTASLEALAAAGVDNLAGKVLIDVSNPLDFSAGFPPSLSVGGNDSLAEQIQRAHPDARVVKALNTMNSQVMVDPARVPGDHDVFMCGDDDEAKEQVRTLLGSFGWPEGSIVDLGELGAARGAEAYVLFWLRLYGAFGTGDLNIKVVR